MDDASRVSNLRPLVATDAFQRNVVTADRCIHARGSAAVSSAVPSRPQVSESFRVSSLAAPHSAGGASFHQEAQQKQQCIKAPFRGQANMFVPIPLRLQNTATSKAPQTMSPTATASQFRVFPSAPTASPAVPLPPPASLTLTSDTSHVTNVQPNASGSGLFSGGAVPRCNPYLFQSSFSEPSSGSTPIDCRFLQPSISSSTLAHAHGRVGMPWVAGMPPRSPNITCSASTPIAGSRPENHWLCKAVLEQLFPPARTSSSLTPTSTSEGFFDKLKTRSAVSPFSNLFVLNNKTLDQDVPLALRPGNSVPLKHSTVSEEMGLDIVRSWDTAPPVSLKRRDYVHKLRSLAQTSTFLRRLDSSEYDNFLNNYAAEAGSVLRQLVPLPFTLQWPGLSSSEAWQTSFGALMNHRLTSSVEKKSANGTMEALSYRDREALLEAFCAARKRFSDASKAAPPLALLDHETLLQAVPSQMSESPLIVALRQAACSHSSAAAERSDEMFPIPPFLYLKVPSFRNATTQREAETCSQASDDNSKEDNLSTLLPFTIAVSDVHQEVCTTEPTPQEIGTESIWDMDEHPSGPLWEEAVFERFEKQLDCLQQHGSMASKSLLWGECARNKGYAASFRYKLVAQKDSFLTPMELNYLFESFDAIDRLTSSEIRLRRCLQHSLTAYHIQDPLERALAFGALILDVNDDALFLTASSETASERQKNADDQTNRALSLTLMDNRRDLYHQPPVTDSAISFNTPSQLIDVTENRAPEKAYDDTWDANSYSSSSGSLSDVVDDWSAFGTGGPESGVPLTTATREAVGKDTKVPDKKMQLKKRSQEKEKRIRLALLGLAPQVVARHADDATRRQQQQQQATPADLSVGSASVAPRSLMATLTGSNAVKDYRDIRRHYQKLTMISRLRLTALSPSTTSHDPYAVAVRPGLEQRDQLELRHSAAAFLFLGVPTRPFPVYVTRFHRPDFRGGLYEMRLKALATLPAGQHVGQQHISSGSGTAPKSSSVSGRRLILKLGQRRQTQQPELLADDNHNSNTTPGGQEAQHLWTTWNVKAPRVSAVVRRARALQDGFLVDNSDGVLPGAGRRGADGQPDTGHLPTFAKHPADLITTAEDLTLADTAPIALLEYSEQSPPLLNNLGMVAQIAKYYRPPSENITLAQAKKKIRGRLGRFGRLKLADSYIPFFGSQMKLARNQGVVVVQSRLFKAPLFPHPTNPHTAPKINQARATTSRYGTDRFHDFRATDFLLVRSRTPTASSVGTTATVQVYLRPLYLEPPPDDRLYRDGDSDDEENAQGNAADCTVYTVGQTQPLGEVPPPTSKRCLEIRRDWLRAYALRLARQGITDFHTVKARCQAKFNNVIEPGILQKHLMSCRDTLTSSASSPVFLGQGLLSIRVVNEEYLRAVCSPEMLCALESAMVTHSQLFQAGLIYLRTPDRVSSAVRELEAEEATARDCLVQARKQLKSYASRFEHLVSSLGPTHPFAAAAERHRKELGATSSNPSLSFFDLISGKRYGPISRLIEEMLLLTPWTITQDCIDVVSRHGGQFTVDGIGDPSGGRGEGISLIRAHPRENGCRGGATLPKGGGGTAGVKTSETQKEDLRKLSMKELHDRLIKFGFDNQIVKSLPRWDQVALVRTFQYDDSRANQPDDGVLSKTGGGRLSNELYIKRLNGVFLNQRRALEADEPAITTSDSDSSVHEKQGQHLYPVSGDVDGDSANKQEPSTANAHLLTAQSAVRLAAPDTTAAPADTNLEDELLSGLQSGSDHEGDGRRTTESSSASCLPYEVEASERKALEEFRQSLGKARYAAELEVSPRLSKIFNPQELRLLQTKPIPRIKWTRKTRDPRTGGVKSEKVIYIYGGENIRLFYEWRRRRVARKQYLDASITAAQAQVGTASRTCRRCGQVGHISSNPICPQYTGPRKARPATAQPGTHHATMTGVARFYHPAPSGCPSSDEETEFDQKSQATTADIASSSFSSTTQRRKGKRGSSAVGSNSAPVQRRTLETERQSKSLRCVKLKDDTNGSVSGGKTRSLEDTAKSSSTTSKLPTRTTARQRLILENKGSLAGGAVQAYQGSFESAVNEINQIFQRVISKTDRDKRKWAVFRDQVSEADAPGYSAVVTNPIWLNKMVEKCKAREYRSTANFLSDIQLLVDNCFRFNPPGHWIRPLVQSLGDFLREETESQGPWLIELDRFIQEHHQDHVTSG